MPDLLISGQFLKNGVPVGGLSDVVVYCSARHKGTGAYTLVANGDAATEDAALSALPAGLYDYVIAAADLTTYDYKAVFYTPGGDVDQNAVPAAWFRFATSATLAAADITGNPTVTLAGTQALYAPAKAGDSMALTGAAVSVVAGAVLVTPANKLATAADGSVSAALTPTGLDLIPTTAPAGVASTFRQMFVQVWRRFFKRVALDADAQTITTYADDGTTALTTQTYTSDGDSEDVGAAS